MNSEQIQWNEKSGWGAIDQEHASKRDLVLTFFDNPLCVSDAWFSQLHAMYPNAIIAGCSTSGSILGTVISDSDAVATAVTFEKSQVRLVSGSVDSNNSVENLGASLGKELLGDNLKHVFILSDGLNINGSDLARGLASALPAGINITGGLAGDGSRFGQTYVIANAPASSNVVAVIGFYGESLSSKTGCFAGWEEFGPERTITKSSGNVLFEIDGKPALELYRSYLGEFAAQLPGSGLRFPISVRPDAHSTPIIRTLLAVDEAQQSLTFAGDTLEGELCRLMKTNMDALIENAGMAARETYDPQDAPFLVLMVSCVGRRLVLGQLCEEETEIIRDTLGEKAIMTGFYSYGELSGLGESRCSLHNQTMTLVSIYE
jgi:hypothetical protein